jgi:hypothetical protein
MYRCLSSEVLASLGEYRGVAEALFPVDGFSPERGVKAAEDFANALGTGVDYQRLFALNKDDEGVRVFLGHFQNNLDLLIQKTWVEKADEARKEKLQDEITPLIALIKQGDFLQAIENFGKVLDELAYLFFGTQSSKEDFTEYTFRIDPQLGLFWWYGSQLSGLKGTDKNDALNGESLWALLLIGLCYLTDF